MPLSERALAFSLDRSHSGSLPESTHYGVAGVPGDGPYFEVWLLVEDGEVKKARFNSFGCPTSNAVGVALCKTAECRTVEVLSMITPEFLNLLVGGVPEGKEHVPRLAAAALHMCVNRNANRRSI